MKPVTSQLTVKVTPRASGTKITIDESGAVKVYVTAPPADGAANVAVIEAVAKRLGIAKSTVSIVRGSSSRTKTLEITGLDSSALESRLRGGA